MKDYKEKKKEKKEIKNIINEIDTIMFGRPMNLKFNKINFTNTFLLGSLGAEIGMGIGLFLDDIKVQSAGLGIGTVIGIITSFYINTDKTHYNEFESAYLKLSRKKQIKVLELSEKLTEMLKADISFDKIENM